MIYMLWNGFCMIWEIHLDIFWHLHKGENMWSASLYGLKGGSFLLEKLIIFMDGGKFRENN